MTNWERLSCGASAGAAPLDSDSRGRPPSRGPRDVFDRPRLSHHPLDGALVTETLTAIGEGRLEGLQSERPAPQSSKAAPRGPRPRPRRHRVGVDPGQPRVGVEGDAVVGRVVVGPGIGALWRRPPNGGIHGAARDPT